VVLAKVTETEMVKATGTVQVEEEVPARKPDS
jgi:hypothetical protein